jgi:hypothetical protein
MDQSAYREDAAWRAFFHMQPSMMEGAALVADWQRHTTATALPI